jgi:hypothetical protein
VRVEPIGVYPVDSPESCHLIEMWLRGDGEVDFGGFTQEVPGQDRSSWQVAYDEWLLNEEGTAGQLAPFPGPVRWDGDLRVAFFFHYLDGTRPLLSLCGPVALPPQSPLPERLGFIEYEPPC